VPDCLCYFPLVIVSYLRSTCAQLLLACCRDPGSPLSGEDGDPTSPPRPDFEPLAEDPHDEGRLGDQVLLLALSPSLT
jgi:hypothetical protein